MTPSPKLESDSPRTQDFDSFGTSEFTRTSVASDSHRTYCLVQPCMHSTCQDYRLHHSLARIYDAQLSQRRPTMSRADHIVHFVQGPPYRAHQNVTPHPLFAWLSQFCKPTHEFYLHGRPSSSKPHPLQEWAGDVLYLHLHTDQHWEPRRHPNTTQRYQQPSRTYPKLASTKDRHNNTFTGPTSSFSISFPLQIQTQTKFNHYMYHRQPRRRSLR